MYTFLLKCPAGVITLTLTIAVNVQCRRSTFFYFIFLWATKMAVYCIKRSKKCALKNVVCTKGKSTTQKLVFLLFDIIGRRIRRGFNERNMLFLSLSHYIIYDTNVICKNIICHRKRSPLYLHTNDSMSSVCLSVARYS